MDQLTVKVLRKTQEAQDIASFELARVDGGPLPAFSAGSHIDVQIPGGLTRQYSLCNDDQESHRYRIAVLRDAASRGGSQGMHAQVQEGDVLTISTPRNHFPLVRAERTLLLAGGIGVTPLLCMAQRLATLSADFELHYCARSAERTAFRAEIAAAPWAQRVHFHFDDGDAAQKLDAARLLATPAAGTHVYVCGPAGFIDHVVGTAKAQGWDQANVHLEYFGAAPQDTSGDGSFTVRIASSGQSVTVAKDQSVVQALLAHGIEIMTSCEQGVCGTCVTRVLEGECEHRDLYFTDAEKAANDQFTPCCSRAKSAVLVLDL
ncbi:vanillate O-demethylase oxidoreductase [Pseudorhodoferax aquiterrae]|uniref:Vanillate O-demethylase oxidoreductase n=1 Tax=Pseudorhodoferax aquiterrae TaxID=747304 RepID=A0ABQ3G1R0_9BURK|nr:PDR/VanB family oxidoreductase [Pseudorhodoferax aquiterrae]GHC83744.1 vanillate O-demethylase oxidoreductase [Pseudorhodoferax aquiterrae]